MGFRTFTIVGEFLWYCCSLACESHLVGMEFNFVMIVPLLPFTEASSLSLDVGYLFFGGFQHPPVDGCSMTSCDLGVLAAGDEHMSYSTILNQNLLVTWCCNFCVFISC